jgi:deoxyribodipyrimidine photo-lyase
VPVTEASNKAEYGAYTLRPKIRRLADACLVDMSPQVVHVRIFDQDPGNAKPRDFLELLEKLRMDRSVAPVSQRFRGGTSRAKKAFDDFLKNRLAFYEQNANQPQTEDVSFMGPYLHFGQISPIYLALAVRRTDGVTQAAKDRFLEQLIVRRELSFNYVVHCPDYDSYEGLPGWAKTTLAVHEKDRRPYLYSPDHLESAETHDPYWNAAMTEMKVTGYLHNYMRMYWAKKILEWSPGPRQAHQTILSLNNRYFLDGRDPNSYAGVSWVFGLHDRPWKERPIFGKVRYMAATGLERKSDIRAYVEKVARIR